MEIAYLRVNHNYDRSLYANQACYAVVNDFRVRKYTRACMTFLISFRFYLRNEKKKKKRERNEKERERERERREKWVSFVAFIGMELLVWDLTKNFNIDLETERFRIDKKLI